MKKSEWIWQPIQTIPMSYLNQYRNVPILGYGIVKDNYDGGTAKVVRFSQSIDHLEDGEKPPKKLQFMYYESNWDELQNELTVGNSFWYPTHWLPLPKLPKDKVSYNFAPIKKRKGTNNIKK